VKYHFVRECADNRQIKVDFIRSEGQLGDFLTKSLGKTKFQELRSKVGLVDVNRLHHKA
jgi:hypothetical protein